MPDTTNTAQDPVAASNTKTQNKFQQQYGQGGKFKEQLESIVGNFGQQEQGPGVVDKVTGKERVVQEVEEIPTQPIELEKKPELAGYIEKIEKEAELAGPIHDDYTGQVLLKPTAPQNPVVILPLTEEQVKEGLQHKVWESIRWLAEWCVRQAKLVHGKIVYKGQEVKS